MSAVRDLAVYVHWPFCLSKCPYCDFNSHVRAGVDQARWRAAYAREIGGYADRLGQARVTSIFFGGGTPSLMDAATVDAVLTRIAQRFALADDIEITLEANPTSAEAGRFADYRVAGVNRLSLGMQALDDASLKFLGREHDAVQARVALTLGMQIFPRVSFDLIYARPGQSVDNWCRELAEALSFGTDHLSVYQLTIEEGTRFADIARAGRLTIPDDDVQADLFDATQELCEAAGLPAYEISNHARPGQESRHNLTYWRSGDWVGIGPGAHGRLATPQGRIATRELRSPESWLSAVETRGTGAEADEIVSPEDVLQEVVLMGLRLREGIAADNFARVTGRQLGEALEPAFGDLLAEGYLAWDGRALKATPRGRLVLNRVVARLLSS
jgi:putative oxygen-independent coproporphyrinogen III oxidase